MSASFRFNYNINPNFTIQYYAQPFISRGRYTDFKYISNSTAGNLNNRFQLYADNQIAFDEDSNIYLVDEDRDGSVDYNLSNPDFSFVQFRSNLVARWEYIPGSEIFLVWSQGITSFVDPFEDLFGGLNTGILEKKPENIFLLKITYRFVL